MKFNLYNKKDKKGTLLNVTSTIFIDHKLSKVWSKICEIEKSDKIKLNEKQAEKKNQQRDNMVKSIKKYCFVLTRFLEKAWF